MKSTKFILSFLLIILLVPACMEEWDEHYNTPPETVDKNMWDVLQEIDSIRDFIGYIKELQIDTLFEKNATYTIFVPTNDAVDDYIIQDSITSTLIFNHISNHFLQSGN
ncbi:hypothetical protein ACFLT1_10190, partial [Bacteroidota bacterium]